MIIDAVLAACREQYKQGKQPTAGIVVSSNQESVSYTPEGVQGLVVYAVGTLSYKPELFKPGSLTPESLHTATSLTCFFSDRLYPATAPPPGGFPTGSRAPFAPRTEELTIVIRPKEIGGGYQATVAIPAWGKSSAKFDLEQRGGVSIGIGPSLGQGASHAVWTFACGSPRFISPIK